MKLAVCLALAGFLASISAAPLEGEEKKCIEFYGAFPSGTDERDADNTVHREMQPKRGLLLRAMP